MSVNLSVFRKMIPIMRVRRNKCPFSDYAVLSSFNRGQDCSSCRLAFDKAAERNGSHISDAKGIENSPLVLCKEVAGCLHAVAVSDFVVACFDVNDQHFSDVFRRLHEGFDAVTIQGFAALGNLVRMIVVEVILFFLLCAFSQGFNQDGSIFNKVDFEGVPFE